MEGLDPELALNGSKTNLGQTLSYPKYLMSAQGWFPFVNEELPTQLPAFKPCSAINFFGFEQVLLVLLANWLCWVIQSNMGGHLCHPLAKLTLSRLYIHCYNSQDSFKYSVGSLSPCESVTNQVGQEIQKKLHLLDWIYILYFIYSSTSFVNLL